MVGIGTTNPTSKLEIIGTGTGSDTSSFWVKNAIGATGLYVNDLGNVGVGTTAPGLYKLNVAGSFMATDYFAGDGTLGATSTVSGLVFKDGLYTSGTLPPFLLTETGDISAVGSMTTGDAFAGAGADGQWLGLGATSGRIYFDEVTGTDHMAFLDTWVGIGESDPSTNLDVLGNIELNNNLYFGNVTTEYLRWDGSDFILSDDFLPSTTADLNLGSDSNRWGDLYLDGATLHIGSSTASEGLISYASNKFSFETSSTAVDIAFFTDDLYIDKSTGYVGVGTTSPSQELDVVGDIELNNYLYFGNGSTEYLRWDGSDFILSDDFLPSSSATLNLGSDTYRWGDLYLDGATLHIGSSTASEGLISYASNVLGFETSSTAVDIAFFTDDLYLDKSTGNVGIGTTSPRTAFELSTTGAVLFVRGTSDSPLYPSSGPGFTVSYDTNGNAWSSGFGSGAVQMSSIGDSVATTTPFRFNASEFGWTNGSATQYMMLNSSGYLGIGTTSPTRTLHSTGTVRFSAYGSGSLITDSSGNISVSSDERLKDLQGSFDKGLAEILDLNPILYKWNLKSGMETNGVYAGLSAQNVQSAIPEAVGIGSDGYLTLSDRPILAAAINAIKEQNTLILNQKTGMLNLESAVKSQQAQIKGLNTSGVISDDGTYIISGSEGTYNLSGSSTGDLLNNSGVFNSLLSAEIETGKVETRELTIDGVTLDDYIKSVLSEAGLDSVAESTESTESIPTTDTGILAEIQSIFEEFKEMILTLGMTAHTDELGNNYLSIDSDVRMSGDLSVLGETTTSNLTVAGNMQVGTLEINSEENSINVLGVSCFNPETGETNQECVEMTDQTLYLQKTLSGNLDVFNGKLVIEPNGTMKLEGNLEVTGTVKSSTVETDTVIINETKTPDIELGSECKPGEMTWDKDYIYICTSENMWSRSKLELIPGQTQAQIETVSEEETDLTNLEVTAPEDSLSGSSSSELDDTIVSGDTSPSEILNP